MLLRHDTNILSKKHSEGLTKSYSQRCRVHSSKVSSKKSPLGIFSSIRKRPVEYATIPAVAAFVGLTTNWMGVKMLFYPIEYIGTEWYRPSMESPHGLFGWQGVVPCKTERMAGRLVDIVTKRLLSLDEAFGRLEPNVLGKLLLPAVETQIERDCGKYWALVIRPVLPYLLYHLLVGLQVEINTVLDLRGVVLSAFVQDKEVLVELFQKVGRVELDFLVKSGLWFGAVLGLGQMAAWVKVPRPWTLPVAGALVGYVTNWIAIKLLFEPAEPVLVGPFRIQGLFESRQNEVSDEFGDFMSTRVLSSQRLLEDLASGGDDGDLHAFLRRKLPYPIPNHILSAAVEAIRNVATKPQDYPHVHSYVSQRLDIEDTLAARLKLLSPTDFEDLLHPVFQEDEITLIACGGVLGAVAGAAQTRLGWGGPTATIRAIVTLCVVGVSSAAFYLFEGGDQEEEQELEKVVEVQQVTVAPKPKLRRRNTIVQRLE